MARVGPAGNDFRTVFPDRVGRELEDLVVGGIGVPRVRWRDLLLGLKSAVVPLLLLLLLLQKAEDLQVEVVSASPCRRTRNPSSRVPAHDKAVAWTPAPPLEPQAEADRV